MVCHVKYLCKKDRKARLKEKALESFDQNLDVRSFASVNSNLALLIWLLLNKEQILLF